MLDRLVLKYQLFINLLRFQVSSFKVVRIVAKYYYKRPFLLIEIPNYKIDKELGTGGMSTVYLATQEILDRKVALKIMSPSLLIDGTFKECFINEGRIISKLSHPHIVHIYDIGISNDACYMAIELLEVDTLRQKIDNKSLSIQDKQRVITQIASALSAAHSQNFIHRDIKPGNILFRENGDAVLTDFGISKVQDTEGEYTTLGFVAGTPSYMPPEFSMGEELDHRADLYSLGVVFYEMLTGEKPYKAKTAAAISYAHVNTPIPQLDPNLAHYQKIIDRVLAKKPEDRFDSVIDFATAIEVAGTSMAPTIIAKRSDAFSQKVQEPQALQTQLEVNATSIEIPSKSEVGNRSSWGLIGGGITAALLAIGIGSYIMLPDSNNAVGIKNITDPTPISALIKTTIEQPDATPSTPPIKPQDEDVVVITGNTSEVKPEPISIENIQTDPMTKPELPLPKKPADEPDTLPVSTITIVDEPTTVVIKTPDKKFEPEVLTGEQIIVVNSLLDNCLVRALTVIKEQIRISKNEDIIEEIQSLKMDSGRTRFITDTQRQIQTSEQRIGDNIATYYKNLTKLKAYKTELVREQLTNFEKEQTKQVNQGIVEILMEHLLKLSKDTLTLEVCKEDLGEYAKNISSTF